VDRTTLADLFSPEELRRYMGEQGITQEPPPSGRASVRPITTPYAPGPGPLHRHPQPTPGDSG
jgi:hypothetical protein